MAIDASMHAGLHFLCLKQKSSKYRVLLEMRRGFKRKDKLVLSIDFAQISSISSLAKSLP
jgi:hypothetical protein